MSGAGFVMVPEWLRAQRPSGNALLIYVTLASYGRFDTAAGVYDECRPPLSMISTDSGLSESTVKRSIVELISMQAIERTERRQSDGTSLPSVYRVRFGQLVQAASDPPGSTGERGEGSTGERGRGPRVSYNPEPSTQNPSTQKPSSRATRLPDGFMPTEEMRAWFVDQHFAGLGINGVVEHEKFCDYWRAQPGSKGTKLDWPATWRNWMRKAAERAPARPRSANASPGGFKTAAEKAQGERERQSAIAKIADRIAEEWKTDPTDYLTNVKITQKATGIYEQRLREVGTNGSTTCSATGYSASSAGDVIDAEWTEHAARREVTAGEP